MENNIGYDNKKAFFDCRLGRIIDDKFLIYGRCNKSFKFEDVAFVEFKKIIDKKCKIVLLVVSFLFIVSGILNVLFFICGLLFLLASVFIETNKYFIHIVKKIPNQVHIPISRSDKKKAIIFVNKINQYRNTNYL